MKKLFLNIGRFFLAIALFFAKSLAGLIFIAIATVLTVPEIFLLLKSSKIETFFDQNILWLLGVYFLLIFVNLGLFLLIPMFYRFLRFIKGKVMSKKLIYS
jgi:hypothetical protein